MQKGKSGIPTDELSLTLAANIEESKPLMVNAYKMLTTDLSTVLQSLNRQLGGTELSSQIETFISPYEDEGGTKQKAKLVQYQETAVEATEKLVELYKKVLEYGYNVQNNIDVTWDNSWLNTKYYKTFKTAITTAITEVEDFLSDMDAATEVGALLNGFRNVYNSYNPKVRKVTANIKTILNQINKITNEDDESQLAGYQNKTVYTPYAE
jgi:hypothetical protein